MHNKYYLIAQKNNGKIECSYISCETLDFDGLKQRQKNCFIYKMVVTRTLLPDDNGRKIMASNGARTGFMYNS